MSGYSIINALILGIIEGVTEFIPVSSSAHLLLIGHFLGFKSPGNSFSILIQLGAISSLLFVYFHKLLKIVIAFPSQEYARHFVACIFVASLPAAVIGFLSYHFIKFVLFEQPILICMTLIIGGIILLVVDRIDFKPRYTNSMNYPLLVAFKIGIFQCLSIFPGVSRSGSTIVGALIMGVDKRSATEFSFFLSMPIVFGACILDFYKNRSVIMHDSGLLIVIGFFSAFLSGLLVVRSFLNFVSKKGYTVFALWRIIFGVISLIALSI
ncbi:Undecaprenyl-diphosphatase [Liberibacter crescens BT-1]|uniref:Undecaprenyl-diphosphatase n=1 Tax=Liberibacter crescens (strain BT-1) TaxID=1215343 RepID=L0EW02_LIBCB|nr:undecaprenyl-diphosphate phosphatase [Liberibacter crescens]AGA65137.1 Undecaprenyl-diphosphatase [Liberibacter crescens BT-1]AMC13107.1 UDP pyrophosphate phosphatase [Liberibacter crescens]